MLKASAPGKIHLIGEHAVVYGEPAILAAVGKRVYVEVERSEFNKVSDKRLGIKDMFSVKEAIETADRLDELWKEGDKKSDFSELFAFFKKNYLKSVVSKILQVLKIKGGVNLTVSSELFIGSGMGSSSAFGVAATEAISEVYGIELPLERVNEIAYEIEKFAHGRPSGGDNSACCFGGLLWFRKGKTGGKPEIRGLKEEIPQKLEGFVLVHTGKPEKTTGELVQHVRELTDSFRSPRIVALGYATEKMLEALKKGDMGKVKEFINMAQKKLSELGVSTERIDRIAEKVRKIGGAAKLCGAGGGGIMLCWHEDRDKLTKTLKEMGEEPIEVELGVEGVKIESD